MNLYKIPALYRELLENVEVDEETGEIFGIEEVEKFKECLGNKVANTGLYLLELNSEEEQLDNEIKRLKNRLNSLRRRDEALRKLVQNIFISTKTDCVKTPFITVNLCKTHRTIIDDQNLLPVELVKTEIKITPDKKAIAEKIKAGEEVDGAHIENFHYVRIK